MGSCIVFWYARLPLTAPDGRGQLHARLALARRAHGPDGGRDDGGIYLLLGIG